MPISRSSRYTALRSSRLVCRRTRAGPCNKSGRRYLLLASSIWSACDFRRLTRRVMSRTFNDAWTRNTWGWKVRRESRKRGRERVKCNGACYWSNRSSTCIEMLCFKTSIVPTIAIVIHDYPDFRSHLDSDRWSSNARAFCLPMLNLAVDLVLHFLPWD